MIYTLYYVKQYRKKMLHLFIKMYNN